MIERMVNNMKADLHCHTLYSDGNLDVSQVIARAKQNNVSVLAITDHDVIDGANEAFKYNNEDFKIIYGVELSTNRNDESVHILGYFKEPLIEGPLVRVMNSQKQKRVTRAEKIVALLKEHFNIKLDTSFIQENRSLTRGTIADEIIAQGYSYSKKEIFDKMLGQGCPCYMPSSKMTPQKGIQLIKENGGIAIVAHPCLYKNNYIMDFIEMGIDGIEGRYPSKFNDESMYRRFTKNFNLLFTAGSDFHRINDFGHGDIGQCTIEGQDLEKFLGALNEH